MNQDYVLGQLKRVKPVLSEKYGITALALFGSYSRNEQTEKSDIDILVDYENPMGMQFFDLVYELEDVFREKNIQVVSRAGIKSQYFHRIKQDLVYAST